MGNSVKERIREFISSSGMTVKDFEKSINRSNGYVNNLSFNLPKALTPIFEAYPNLNPTWVIFGEGTMLKSEEPPNIEPTPYFDNFTIQAGSASGFGDESAVKPTGYMNIPGVSAAGGAFFIKVRGESMLSRNNPQRSIPDGSWVALRKVTTSSIMWGEVYAFMTTDGPIVKRIMPSEQEGYIKCVSFNEEDGYAPFDLPVREIIGGDFFMVTAVVNINIL